ncbi:P-type conjugative transfer protein TrbL [Xanthomonas campestris]|uniref:P-type conjugative transfer protein TrbL n=1 Tax=Xanthomonas campestris TaxID=339 RepID=UPI001E652E45|nr:P-type conjugative transfer protein TrbL [Xanthomonas campestris]MCC5064039.1 P-type conjugative transfer protein TrbL [Xanthomonas campestris pv. raphani]MEA9890477.1 P-type conjugative transfer protein TrbL [Xanthomonas campestris pv. raphani]MEA9974915.1 P-type conjugative transfer protein TrbL [Xanthomonas campestris pv. raphani]
MKTLLTRPGPAVLGAVLFLVLFSADAHAAVDNYDILDGIVKELKTVTETMAGKLVGFATTLFWSLAVINMVWTFGMMVMRKADIGEFFAELARFIITLGFFWWLLSNAVTGMNIAGTIIESMRDMAAQATGLGRELSPSGIVDVGFDVLKRVMNADMGLAETIVAFAVAIIILLIFAAVGVNMVVALAESWFLLYGGLFVLGFGGSRWTTDIAIGYYRQVLGVGFKLFGMAAIVGIGATFVNTYVARLTANVRLTELAVMLVAAYVFYKLSDRIPSMMASLISGGGPGGGFSGIGGAVSAGAVAGAAAGLAAAAASGGASVAASAAGGAQAVMAAASAAAQAADGGGGGMSSASGSSGESGGGGAGDEPMAAASGGGGSPMAQAAGDGASGGGGSSSRAGRAGQIAKGTVANLAKGIGSMASAKASSMTDAAKSRIAETAGGKLAATIKAANSSTADNSLSGPKNKASAGAGNDEVAAFVNRPQET